MSNHQNRGKGFTHHDDDSCRGSISKNTILDEILVTFEFDNDLTKVKKQLLAEVLDLIGEDLIDNANGEWVESANNLKYLFRKAAKERFK